MLSRGPIQLRLHCHAWELLWANRRFLLSACAGGIWLSKCVWFKGLSWYPVSNFQQVPITVLHLPAGVMGQMQLLCTLNMCSYSTSNIVNLGPELPTSPRTHMLSWKYGGIPALLGSRFASVNQFLFCCTSWEPSVAKTQAVTVQKRSLLYTSAKEAVEEFGGFFCWFLVTPPAFLQVAGNKTELRGCFSNCSHIPYFSLIWLVLSF